MTTILNMTALDPPHMTLLFVVTIAALATALVVMFSEFERSDKAQRIRVSLLRLMNRRDR